MCEFCFYTDYDVDFKDFRPYETKDDSITLAYSAVDGYHYLVNNLGNEAENGDLDYFHVQYCPYCGRKLVHNVKNEQEPKPVRFQE